MQGDSGLIRETLMESLDDPEIDDLGDRDSVLNCHEHVRRFDITVDDAFLMRMLNRSTYLDKHLQPFPHSQTITVAVIGDGNSRYVFHYTVRPAVAYGSGIQGPGNIRVV